MNRYESEDSALIPVDRPARMAPSIRGTRAGRWALWFGSLMAGIWFGVVGMLGFGTPILDNFKSDPYLFSAIIAALATPGILVFFAGLFACAQRQAAEANALVLEAANQLLLPSAQASDMAHSHAQSLRTDAETIERAMGQAANVLQSFTAELATRQNTLFESTGNAVERTETLIRQLGDERQALDNLTATINAQMAKIGEGVPRQAQILAEALKSAGNEVQNAEQTLEARLQDFDSAESRLVTRMQDIDKLAKSTVAYTEKLENLVDQIETRLNETTKLIDAAVKAGEIASTAAQSTGQALQNAVSDALDGARIANDEIAAKTLETAREAARALKALKTAGTETQTLYKTLSDRAKSREALDSVEAPHLRISASNSTDTLHDGDASIPEWVQASQTVTTKSDVSGGQNDRVKTPNTVDSQSGPVRDHIAELEDTLFETDPDSIPDIAGKQEKFEGEKLDAESSFIITELDAPAEASIRLSKLVDEAASIQQPESGRARTEIEGHERREESSESGARHTHRNAQKNGNKPDGWGAILAGVDRASGAELPDRETVAETLVLTLEQAGLELDRIFSGKDKKRIAVAARRGDYARRAAIKECVRSHVGVADSIIADDPDLKRAARIFLNYESSEALQALEKTHKSGKPAGVRLAVFLLIDAAVGKAQAA